MIIETYRGFAITKSDQGLMSNGVDELFITDLAGPYETIEQARIDIDCFHSYIADFDAQVGR